MTNEISRRLYNAKYSMDKKLGLSTTRKCIRCSELTDNMRLCDGCFWNERSDCDPIKCRMCSEYTHNKSLCDGCYKIESSRRRKCTRCSEFTDNKGLCDGCDRFEREGWKVCQVFGPHGHHVSV